jgi:hypothetical protein
MPKLVEDTSSPPIMPVFTTRWLFAGMIVVAGGVLLALNSSDSKLLGSFGLVLATGVVFLVLLAFCFVVAYSFGLIRHVIEASHQEPESPFAGDNYPPQLIPRKE